MALIIAAALLGLFGGRGPLTATSAEGHRALPFELEYRRFDRFKAPTMRRGFKASAEEVPSRMRA